MEMKKTIIKTATIVLILTVVTGIFGVLISEETFAAKQKVTIKKITLSKSSISLKEGNTAKLSVKYTPKTSTKKNVKWKSSKNSVATVKKGLVTGKKVGHATITAKIGKKSAKCKVRVTKDDNFVDATEAYSCLNDFRTETSVWYWNEDDKTKTYFNTNSGNKLKSLKRDKGLEKVAKVRAKEIAKKFSHTRPNGRDCFTAYPNSLWACGENIAYGAKTGKEVTKLWKESNYYYSGQGHRRNMLDKGFNSVGIAGYKKGGRIYWVQAFGKR